MIIKSIIIYNIDHTAPKSLTKNTTMIVIPSKYFFFIIVKTFEYFIKSI